MAPALFSLTCGIAVACATGSTLEEDVTGAGSANTGGGSGTSTGVTGSSGNPGNTTGSSGTASNGSGAATGTGGSSTGATTTTGTGGAGGSANNGAGGSSSSSTSAASTSAASTSAASSGAGGAGGGTTCGPNMVDCDGNPLNGCQDLQTDPNHCGMCMNACPMAEGGPKCTNGKCHITVTILHDQIEDSFIHSGAANTNLGSDAALLIDDDDSNDQYITFIQPTSLGSLPIGAGATIVNARLEMSCYNPGDNVGVHLVTGAWTESTITWSNAPTFTSSAFVTVSQCSTPTSINIASALTAWAGGQAQHGLRMRTSGSDGTDWRSTEFGTVAQRPKIVFTYY